MKYQSVLDFLRWPTGLSQLPRSRRRRSIWFLIMNPLPFELLFPKPLYQCRKSSLGAATWAFDFSKPALIGLVQVLNLLLILSKNLGFWRFRRTWLLPNFEGAKRFCLSPYFVAMPFWRFVESLRIGVYWHFWILILEFDNVEGKLFVCVRLYLLSTVIWS